MLICSLFINYRTQQSDFNRYSQDVTQQDNDCFHVVDLTESIQKLVVEYKNANQDAAPEELLVYRDSVPCGEIDAVRYLLCYILLTISVCWKVRSLELPMIRAAVGEDTRITYVLTTRDRIRMFPDRAGQDKKGNPSAGLAVDKGISSKHLMEFRLQSHAAISGMPKMTRYIVLKDFTSEHRLKHTLDALTEMTYQVYAQLSCSTYFVLCVQLCFVHGRCTRSLSKVPALYYAELAGMMLVFVVGRLMISFQQHAIRTTSTKVWRT